jgi:hydroxypyruvate isomerase
MTNTLSLCAHLGYLFEDLPLAKKLAAAADAGFEWVEHPGPYDMPSERFAQIMEENGLRCAQIGLATGGGEQKGLAAIADRRSDFLATLDEAIDYATQIGCRLIHPMSGVPAPSSNPDETWRVYIENLECACASAGEAGLKVIIEPISGGTLAGYFMNHPDLALQALDEVGAENLRISLDAYHAAFVGVDPSAFVRNHGAKIAHVQISDLPGRGEPGTGELPFHEFFQMLQAATYPGVVGLEYIPAAGTVSGLGWVASYPEVRPLRSR